MPYSYHKVPNKRCYTVFNNNTNKVFSKCTSKKKALSQIRLLRAIENDSSFANKVRSNRKFTRTKRIKKRTNSTRKAKK